MKSIVVATDFSQNAMHAAHRAALVARASDSERLLLLHVRPSSPRWSRRGAKSASAHEQFDHAAWKLDALAENLRATAASAVEGRVVEGDRIQTIARSAVDADLLVVGASARSSLLHPMIGSARRLLRHTRAPVLVVRTPPASPYRRVLLAVDLPSASEAAFAQTRAVAPGARTSIVHAFRAPLEGKLRYAGVSDDAIDAYRADTLCSAVFAMTHVLRSPSAPADAAAHIVNGQAAPALLEKSRAFAADLVVVTRSRRSLPGELFVPSVTSTLLDEGDTDLLVVRA